MYALENRDTRLRAYEVGADDFMEKSFDKFFLATKCNSLLRVKHLSTELRLQYTELTAKNDLLEMQLKMAKAIQNALIPKIDLVLNGAKVLSHYRPAFDIGGDFFAINRFYNDFSDAYFSIVIGDVSGHGISSALLTALMEMLNRQIISEGVIEPDRYLKKLNSGFNKMINEAESGIEMSTTVFYAYFDVPNRKIYYSNAGHPYPFLVRDSGKTVTELAINGTPVGMFENSEYAVNSVDYEDGDLLLMYSDGLNNAFYKDNTDTFNDEMSELLSNLPNDISLESIMSMLMDGFYPADLSDDAKLKVDDVCMILCRFG
jgi:sigma-B regulation protein RsbU (phosphoserine phosphatase)